MPVRSEIDMILVLFLFLGCIFASNPQGLRFLENNKQKEGVVVLPRYETLFVNVISFSILSGLQYKILSKGSGEFHPLVDSKCECHYIGTLIDGTEFDSSYRRGKPTTFAPNQVILSKYVIDSSDREVIAGWTEAMQLMTEGDKWELYIPSGMVFASST
jgi:FKBP-type peptidyl-prolyl cis-trans isomerase FklB